MLLLLFLHVISSLTMKSVVNNVAVIYFAVVTASVLFWCLATLWRFRSSRMDSTIFFSLRVLWPVIMGEIKGKERCNLTENHLTVADEIII